MFQCSYANYLEHKADFCLSIIENLESGSESDKYKVKSLCGRWTKKEEKI